jgi:hypothetical protein
MASVLESRRHNTIRPMKTTVLTAVAVIVLCGSVSGQTVPASDSQVKADVNHLMDTHVGVEQTVPKGWSISAKGVGSQTGPDGRPIMQVHIFINGAPDGTIFEQQVIPVGEDKPTSETQGITAGKDGILMCAGRTPEECTGNGPDDPVEFTMQPYKGEPFRFLFVSDKGTIGTVIVPYPVAGKDHNCTLSAVRLTPMFDLALITATGVPPNTDIHYTSTGSSSPQVIKSDSRGVLRFSFIPHPDHRGQTSGTMKIKLQEPQCSPEVSYNWGKL